jgi:hypothetical protein
MTGKMNWDRARYRSSPDIGASIAIEYERRNKKPTPKVKYEPPPHDYWRSIKNSKAEERRILQDREQQRLRRKAGVT